MSWDTEGTRRQLKAAAVVEFAAHGPAGTTMSAIADRAGINKERLYKYFGDKAGLFASVLADELAKLSAAVAVTGVGIDEIGEFAANTFDYHAAHPELARLLMWEGLAGGAAADEANRTEHYRQKVAAFAAAQIDGTLDDDLPPDHLLLMIIALAAWWQAVPQLAHMVTGADPDDSVERDRRRAFVVRAAQRLALPAGRLVG